MQTLPTTRIYPCFKCMLHLRSVLFTPCVVLISPPLKQVWNVHSPPSKRQKNYKVSCLWGVLYETVIQRLLGCTIGSAILFNMVTTSWRIASNNTNESCVWQIQSGPKHRWLHWTCSRPLSGWYVSLHSSPPIKQSTHICIKHVSCAYNALITQSDFASCCNILIACCVHAVRISLQLAIGLRILFHPHEVCGIPYQVSWPVQSVSFNEFSELCYIYLQVHYCAQYRKACNQTRTGSVSFTFVPIWCFGGIPTFLTFNFVPYCYSEREVDKLVRRFAWSVKKHLLAQSEDLCEAQIDGSHTYKIPG